LTFQIFIQKKVNATEPFLHQMPQLAEPITGWMPTQHLTMELVVFLNTLSDNTLTNDPKFSDPFLTAF